MRFYVSPDSIFPDKNIIQIKDKDEIHHIRDVMRLKKGSDVNIFDGKGREFSGMIERIDKDLVLIKIKEELVCKYNMPFKVSLYQAIPKKDKMELIVEKAVELGIEHIIPIITERTIPDIGDKKDKKIERWRRISVSASKQCGRTKLPVVSDVKNFNNAIVEAKQKDLAILAALDKSARPLKEVISHLKPKDIAVFVGPEGDFSRQEISIARENGCKICSLGYLVLKSDTAAIYILSCLNYEYSMHQAQ